MFPINRPESKIISLLVRSNESKPIFTSIRTSHMANRLFLGLLWFLLSLVKVDVVVAQDSLAPLKFEKTRIRRSITRSPERLVQEITSDLTTDKEKFDALFTWVVFHVRFDQRSYKRSRTSPTYRHIEDVLRHRRGLALDIAHLMDTLCDLAGIQNTTVEGMVKEITFDLGDTLHMSNHAWNAVKLDGRWYVYDLVWCRGSIETEYTKFGKWRLKQIERLSLKRKPVHFTLVYNANKSKYCTDTLKPKVIEFRDTILKFWPRVAINLLNLPRYRMKTRFYSVMNTHYYLANPEFFAITHYPDFEPFDLTPKFHSMLEFSQDSIYYYRDQYTYSRFERNGVFCLDCDVISTKKSINRWAQIQGQTSSNNPFNHYIPGTYLLEMATYFKNQAVGETDSLTKMHLIDSVLLYVDSCRGEYKQCRSRSILEARSLSAKERLKYKLLTADNKKHRQFASKTMQQIVKRYRKMDQMVSMSHGYARKTHRFHKHTLPRALNTEVKAKNLKQEQKLVLQHSFELQSQKVDSLTSMIEINQQQYKAELLRLFPNIISLHDALDPLIGSMYKDSYQRILKNRDQYEESILLIRRTLELHRMMAQDSIEIKLLNAVDSLKNTQLTIIQLSNERNRAVVKQIKLAKSLLVNKLMDPEVYTSLVAGSKNQVQDNLCWNEEIKSLVRSIQKQFGFFKRSFRYYQRMIEHNNRLERKRLNRFQKQISRTHRTQLNTVLKRQNEAKLLQKNIQQHRKDFLQKRR